MNERDVPTKYDFTWPVTVMLYDDFLKLNTCIEQNKTKFI